MDIDEAAAVKEDEAGVDVIRIINLWEPTGDCFVCEEECPLAYAVAVYEDEILPDDYPGEWFGAPVCGRCYNIVIETQARCPGQILSLGDVRNERTA